MNFPKFDKIVEELTNQYPEIEEPKILNLAAGRLIVRWAGGQTARDLYLLKLYKHRPAVKLAADASINWSKSVILSDLTFDTKMRNYNAKLEACNNTITAAVNKLNQM